MGFVWNWDSVEMGVLLDTTDILINGHDDEFPEITHVYITIRSPNPFRPSNFQTRFQIHLPRHSCPTPQYSRDRRYLMFLSYDNDRSNSIS
jgi:hypothetical protein